MRPIKNIKIQPSHVGLLHKQMGVPTNQPIGLADLKEEKDETTGATADPATKRRVQFALNAKKWGG